MILLNYRQRLIHNSFSVAGNHEICKEVSNSSSFKWDYSAQVLEFSLGHSHEVWIGTGFPLSHGHPKEVTKGLAGPKTFQVPRGSISKMSFFFPQLKILYREKTVGQASTLGCAPKKPSHGWSWAYSFPPLYASLEYPQEVPSSYPASASAPQNVERSAWKTAEKCATGYTGHSLSRRGSSYFLEKKVVLGLWRIIGCMARALQNEFN